MTAENLRADQRAQEQLTATTLQNLGNQINQLSSKIFKVTPEGVEVTDPYALRQYQQLVNRFASLSTGAKPQGVPDILSTPIEDVTAMGAAMPPPPAPDQIPSERLPGESTEQQILEAKTKQAAAKKQAEQNVLTQADKKKNVQMATKLLERIGYDPEKDTSDTEQLIEGSTGGGLQKLGADVLGYINVSTPGMQNIGALDALSTEISKDFLGGNLGAGISNADREFITRMTGDISNPSIPTDQRKAAFREFVKGLKLIKERGYYFGTGDATMVQPSGRGAAPEPSAENLDLDEIDAIVGIKR
jgi:hypothetical protein